MQLQGNCGSTVVSLVAFRRAPPGLHLKLTWTKLGCSTLHAVQQRCQFRSTKRATEARASCSESKSGVATRPLPGWESRRTPTSSVVDCIHAWGGRLQVRSPAAAALPPPSPLPLLLPCLQPLLQVNASASLAGASALQQSHPAWAGSPQLRPRQQRQGAAGAGRTSGGRRSVA